MVGQLSGAASGRLGARPQNRACRTDSATAVNTATDPAPADPRSQFIDAVRAALGGGQLARLQLSKYVGPEPELQRLIVRPVQLRGELQLSLLYRYRTRDITKNLAIEAGLALLAEQLAGSYEHAHLQTDREDIQLIVNRKGRARLQRGRVAVAATATPANAAIDREKHRFVELGQPFLVELGVTDAQHRLVPAMARKWKQSNKFVEVLAHAVATAALPASDEPLRVLDFGAGKGYLTFAVHDYLSTTLGRAVQVTGVDLKDDMVALGNEAAARLGLQGLRFEHGDVRDYAQQGVDIMIALHACDVATDYAIHMGVRAGAQIIMCSPCCHKQLRPQMRSPLLLLPLLRHGIHLGQEAEMLTDGLRALLLEAEGYETQVFEFTSLEHTSKNKMILAVKRGASVARRAELLEQVGELKRFYGVSEQCLETLLWQEPAGPAPQGVSLSLLAQRK
jgi:SAM-dependent methyltransferase